MRRLSLALSGLGFLWALAATIYLLTGAGYESFSTDAALPGGGETVGHMSVSLVSANGPWVVALLSIVTLLAGIPLGVGLAHPRGHRGTTWTFGLLIVGFSIVAGFSVGLTYLPVGLVLIAAAAVSERATPRAP